jgi:hypothetical protein
MSARAALGCPAERPSARFTAGGRSGPAGPGLAYSFGAAREPGRTSWTWTARLDAVPLGPTDDATTVPAAQLRAALERLITAGHCSGDDPDIRLVTDAGYDSTRLAVMLYIGLDQASDVADSAGEQRALAGSSELVRAWTCPRSRDARSAPQYV